MCDEVHPSDLPDLKDRLEQAVALVERKIRKHNVVTAATAPKSHRGAA